MGLTRVDYFLAVDIKGIRLTADTGMWDMVINLSGM